MQQKQASDHTLLVQRCYSKSIYTLDAVPIFHDFLPYYQIFYFSVLLLCKINVIDICNTVEISDFCYITKYRNSDRIKFSAFGVCCMGAAPLRMYHTYIPNQKFDLTRISVLRAITKIRNKSPISKISRTLFLHNSLAKKL